MVLQSIEICRFTKDVVALIYPESVSASTSSRLADCLAYSSTDLFINWEFCERPWFPIFGTFQKYLSEYIIFNNTNVSCYDMSGWGIIVLCGSARASECGCRLEITETSWADAHGITYIYHRAWRKVLHELHLFTSD